MRYQLHHAATGRGTAQHVIQGDRRIAGNGLLTVHEVAARLKMNPETVRRWLREGKLRGYLLGGDRGGYRVAESDLTEFLAGRRTVASPDGT